MATKQNIREPHRTRFAKCKGRLADPPEAFGEWAYWWADGSGWHATMKPAEQPKAEGPRSYRARIGEDQWEENGT